MNEISIQQLINITNPNIIDIRDKYSYQAGNLKNSINIPYYSLLSNYSFYLNKKDIYYLYCDYGKQSKEISDRLNSFGYNTTSLKGGYLQYKK
jgi:rhodanese-related sulfurtransferase